MSTSSSSSAEVTLDRAQSEAGRRFDTAAVSIPTRVTVRVVAICLAMILAEGYDVAIYGGACWHRLVFVGAASGHHRELLAGGHDDRCDGRRYAQ